MRDLVDGSRRMDLGSPVFVHRASVEDADEFFRRRAPEARAIADPDGELFRAFDLERGSLWQLFGPAVWIQGLRARFKGHGVGRPKGDPMQMPGEILHEHRARSAGDHPPVDEVLAQVRRARARTG